MNTNFDKTLNVFADLIINKIQTIEQDWQKPWLCCAHNPHFIPQNISGRNYSYGNAFLLSVLCEFHNFQTPVFLTFLQAKELNLAIQKGSHSFPVYYVCRLYYHKETQCKISEKEYNELSENQKQNYRIVPCLKSYNVFNLDQTNYPEVFPDEWNVKKDFFTAKEPEEKTGMYANTVLDKLFQTQSWVCPIHIKLSNKAFFSPVKDYIQLPLKNQFKDGQSFYATAVHEMSHSTGTENRLNRKIENAFGSVDYGREELVAELSAAVTGLYLGISSTIREENVTYLKAWIESIREEPKFLLSVLSDVSKVAKFILSYLLDSEIPIPTDTGVLTA